MPKARIATTEAWMPMLMRFGTVRKLGVAMNSPMHSRIRPTRAPLFIAQRPRRLGGGGAGRVGRGGVVAAVRAAAPFGGVGGAVRAGPVRTPRRSGGRRR